MRVSRNPRGVSPENTCPKPQQVRRRFQRLEGRPTAKLPGEAAMKSENSTRTNARPGAANCLAICQGGLGPL
eukprot:11158331-Lingulodinium_polyedra.AAC.1